MSTLLRNSSLAVALLVLAVPMLSVDASAKSTFMQECSAKWKAAKDANTVPAAMKWPEFMKTQCGANPDQPAVAQPAAPAAKAVKAATAAKPTTAAKPGAAAASNTGMIQKCSAQWKAMKDAGTLPAGLKWTQFLKQQCQFTAIAVPEDTAVPAEPTNANYANYNAPVSTVDKNGKPLSAGQIAARQRIKQCAAEWHSDKAAGTLPAGQKWPQFWSACNTRLKSQG